MIGPPGAVPPDLSNAEIVDFTIIEGDSRVRLKLKDGSVVEIRFEIMHVLRAGNDPNTGFPAYIVQQAALVRLVETPKELRKPPLRPGGKTDGKAIPGFG
jgi:hypothetical protein